MDPLHLARLRVESALESRERARRALDRDPAAHLAVDAAERDLRRAQEALRSLLTREPEEKAWSSH